MNNQILLEEVVARITVDLLELLLLPTGRVADETVSTVTEIKRLIEDNLRVYETWQSK